MGIPEGTVLVKSVYQTTGSFAVENGKVLRVRDVIYSNCSEDNNSTNDCYAIRLGIDSFPERSNTIINSINGRYTTGQKNVTYTPVIPTKSPDTSSKPEQYEVRLRLFIPSPALKIIGNDFSCRFANNTFCVCGGDNRRFSHNARSYRYIANTIVNTDSKNKSQIIGVPFRNFCPTNRFLPSQSSESLGKPWWWLNLNPGVKPIDTTKLELVSQVNKVNSVKVALVPGESSTVKVSFKVNGTNPSVSVAPAFEAGIDVVIQDKPGQKPLVRIEGKHDGFPAYEIYVNTQLVYGYNPEFVASPRNLYPPLDVIVSKPWTEWNLIKNKYSEQKLPSC